MSHSDTTIATALFTDSELSQFQKDDLTAGKFIGRTLVLIFLYSAIVMGGVVWWTEGSIAQRIESSTQSPTAIPAK